MELFDSHCHLDDRLFHDDLDAVLDRAKQNNVVKSLTVGVTLESSVRAVELAGDWPEVYASVGIHPHDAKDCSEQALNRLQELAGHRKVHAWGEIGLDFNRMFSPREDQEHWLIRQLEISGELELPAIFHERDSGGRLLDILGDHYSAGRAGVVHCFSGTRDELEKYLEMGLYIGITGIVTIKQRGAFLRELVTQIPSEKILVETDAPYLVPAPERNQTRRNEPAFVRSVLNRLAEVRGEDPDELARITYQNTCRLFRIEP